MNRAPQFGAIVASPVEDGQDVDNTVACGKVRLNAIGKGYTRVCPQHFVFLCGVEPCVAAGDDPQHIVIVKGEVPLHVSGAILNDVLYIALYRCPERWIEVAMPVGGAMVAAPGCTSTSLS